MNDTGAALTGVTSDMGPSETKMIAQQVDQQRAILDIGGHRLAVDR